MSDTLSKKAIVTSIVATILFVYLLDPILRIIGFVLFNFGFSLFRSFIDNMYKSSALLSMPDPAGSLSSLVYGIVSGVLISGTTFLFFLEKPIKSTKEKKVFFFAKKHLPFGFILFTLIFIMFSFLKIYKDGFESRLISSFNQHLVTIAPYISDQDLKLLKSKWTQMKYEDDYNDIYKQLNDIAIQNKVDLPKNYRY
jgi:hypothetical protein